MDKFKVGDKISLEHSSTALAIIIVAEDEPNIPGCLRYHIIYKVDNGYEEDDGYNWYGSNFIKIGEAKCPEY